MLIIEKRKFIKIAVFLAITVALALSASIFKDKKTAALAGKKTNIIVLDAGHGEYF